MTAAPPRFDGRDRVLAFTDSLQTAPQAPAGPAAQWETWVTFRLGKELYGLSVAAVREIVRVQTITRVPHAPFPIRGIVNLRGRVVPAMDLRVRLGLPGAAITGDSRILVCHAAGRTVGLLADAAHQVVQVDRLRVEAPPADIVSERSDYVEGVYEDGPAFVILLKADAVLMIPDGLGRTEANLTPAQTGQPESEGRQTNA